MFNIMLFCFICIVQFFTAPGGTEIAVAKNEISLKRALKDGAPDMTGITTLKEIGFMPVFYSLNEKVQSKRCLRFVFIATLFA
jgi:hypothetical protein